MLKDEYIFKQNIRKQVFSNSTRKLLWFEITKLVIAVKNKFLVLLIVIFGTLSFPLYVGPTERHEEEICNKLALSSVVCCGIAVRIDVCTDNCRPTSLCNTRMHNLASVACSMMECCRVDDTLPERVVTGVSPG